MPPKSLKNITLEEFDKHNSEQSLWMLYNGEVVDVTEYLPEHPGGIDAIVDFAAADGTSAFDAIGHSESAKAKLREFVIGTLNDEDRKTVEGRTKKSGGGGATIIVIVLLVIIALYFALM